MTLKKFLSTLRARGFDGKRKVLATARRIERAIQEGEISSPAKEADGNRRIYTAQHIEEAKTVLSRLTDKAVRGGRL